MKLTFNELVGGLITVIAVLAVVYASIVQGRTDAMTALVGVSGAGVGFFLRAKVQAPNP